MQPVVACHGIINRFGTQVVHDGVDMEVFPGEVFGIVGGSGSGKSVLLRTLLGLRQPEAGTVELEGRELTGMTSAELLEAKRRYGVTFQAGALFSSLTVAENVMLPIAERHRLSRETLAELAALKLALVGLPPEAGAKFPAQLSGGMVKRAALARALALDPAVLFLDEPTAGLDPISAAAFDRLVLYLQRSLRLTMVMITHDLDTIFRTCNRVGVLVEGRMISGTLAEIESHPHPWIREYFHGERARVAAEAASHG